MFTIHFDLLTSQRHFDHVICIFVWLLWWGFSFRSILNKILFFSFAFIYFFFFCFLLFFAFLLFSCHFNYTFMFCIQIFCTWMYKSVLQTFKNFVVNSRSVTKPIARFRWSKILRSFEFNTENILLFTFYFYLSALIPLFWRATAKMVAFLDKYTYIDIYIYILDLYIVFK